MVLATFDDLKTWKATITALQQAAQVIGRVQSALNPKRRNYLHLSLNVQPYGLDSQPLPNYVCLRVDFRRRALVYLRNGEMRQYPLADQTQASLMDAIAAQLHRDGQTTPVVLADAKTDMLDVDEKAAAAYADAQYAAFTGIARFRARLEGHFTPVVVWPHHMDVSTLIFGDANADMDDGREHLNFGYAPFTEGQYERPYLYAYAHPVTYPADFRPPALPAPAVWNKEGWQGAALHHADIARQSDPAAFIEQMCLGIYDALLPLISR